MDNPKKYPRIILINKTNVTVYSHHELTDDIALSVATDAVYDIMPDQNKHQELSILVDPANMTYQALSGEEGH